MAESPRADGATPPSVGAAMAAGESLHIRPDRALLHMTLQRQPRGDTDAANAMTHAMTSMMSAAFTRWGVDPGIYAIVLDSNVQGVFHARTELAERAGLIETVEAAIARRAAQTRLLWQIECCVKPMASLIDGTVAGLGAGMAQMGTHQVAGEGYSLALAGMQFGVVPAAGSTAALARLPANVGLYLAVTGTWIGRADAYALGLVTHCIDQRDFEAIRHGLADADPIDPILDDLHRHPGDGPLTGLRPAIERCFAHPTCPAIIEALNLESGENRSWARQTAALIAGAARDDLEITLHHVRMVRGRDLKETLEREHRLAVIGLQRLAGRPIDALPARDGAHDLVLPPRPQSLVALS